MGREILQRGMIERDYAPDLPKLVVPRNRVTQVLVSSVTAQKNGLRTAWIRVEYKEPTKLPQGGPFVELRARVRFSCASGSEVPTAEWFYARDHSGKFVVSKKVRRDDLFGTDPEGGFGEMAGKFVCEQR